MAYETLLVEQSRGIVTVTLNRPERLNAVVPEMMIELADALNAVEIEKRKPRFARPAEGVTG